MSPLLAGAPALLPTYEKVGNPALNIGVFAGFVLITLFIPVLDRLPGGLARGIAAGRRADA